MQCAMCKEDKDEAEFKDKKARIWTTCACCREEKRERSARLRAQLGQAEKQRIILEREAVMFAGLGEENLEMGRLRY